MIKAGIIGATGYAGEELARLLLRHPEAELAAVSSVSFTGQKLSEVYPSLADICDMVLTDEDTVIAGSDVVFASLPHGLSEQIAEKCAAQGKRLIDLGADFRLTDPAEYEKWYGLSYQKPELHDRAVYCIPELHRALVGEDTAIIGNPGCYPTSIGLALAPLLQEGLVRPDSIIIDAKSGVTGAGRGLSQTTHYPDCNEAFSPYKIAEHRHTPEIEQTLSGLAGEQVKITFVPHLLPVNRGIVSTIYADSRRAVTTEELYQLYQVSYQNEPFVRVLPQGTVANLGRIKYANYYDLSLHTDPRTGRIILVSAIDNMVKGAAGQAIQNMNLWYGLDETTGLTMIPPAF